MTEGRPAEIYDDKPRTCPVCRDPLPGFREYWDHAEHDHGWVWRDGKIRPPDDEQIGMGRSALYVLGIWPTPRVHRGTVRALAGVNVGSGSSSRLQFARSIKRAEADGLLLRDGDWICVLDRAALYERAVDRIASPTHEKFLAIVDSIAVVRAQVAAERDAVRRTERERELQFIRSLMRPYAGPMTGSGRPVRVVATGRP